jgi:hypothetical protein
MKKLQATWTLQKDGDLINISELLKDFRDKAFTAENFLEFLESGMTQEEWISKYIRNSIFVD